MRGTPIAVDVVRGYLEIIPACAGNTRLSAHDAVYGRDHPRVCGEHNLDEATNIGIAGSSPRVRGTLADDDGHGRLLGIIPACAGNTDAAGGALSAVGDHPRVCGEHSRKYQFKIP